MNLVFNVHSGSSMIFLHAILFGDIHVKNLTATLSLFSLFPTKFKEPSHFDFVLPAASLYTYRSGMVAHKMIQQIMFHEKSTIKLYFRIV